MSAHPTAHSADIHQSKDTLCIAPFNFLLLHFIQNIQVPINQLWCAKNGKTN
jgi:hypothetical protein